MATAYNKLKWTDHNGIHNAGDEIELPTTTPSEQADFDRLLDHGVITRYKPEPLVKPQPEELPAPEPVEDDEVVESDEAEPEDKGEDADK